MAFSATSQSLSLHILKMADDCLKTVKQKGSVWLCVTINGFSVCVEILLNYFPKTEYFVAYFDQYLRKMYNPFDTIYDPID